MFRKLLNSELGRLSGEEFREAPKSGAVILLDNIRSQHNIGSAFRTADAFRIDKVVLCGISAPPGSPQMHKTALGAEFSMEWEYFDDTCRAIAELRAQGYVIVGVEQTEGSVPLGEFEPAEGVRYAYLFGNEVRGVSQEAADMCDLCIEIPQFGTKHSLNVSVAAGIVLWHAVGRKLKGAPKL